MKAYIFTSNRLVRRLFYCLISVLLAVNLLHALPPGTAVTTISDVVYRADGTPAQGTLVISWPTFTTADHRAIAAGSLSLAIGPGGAVSVALAPNEGGSPAGTYYKVVYKLDDGSTSEEYWSVPAVSTTTISAIRSKIVPASVAMQVASRQYVDSAIAAATTSGGTDTKALNGLRFPSGFTGPNRTAKTDAAIADCGGARCSIAPTTNLTGSGDPTLATWSEFAPIFDFSQYRPEAGRVQPANFALHIAQRKLTATDSYPYDYGVLGLELLHQGGGSNVLNGKTGYKALGITWTSQAPGESKVIEILGSHHSSGDLFDIIGDIGYDGDCLSAGDECAVGAKFAFRHGTFTFTAKVASYTDNGSDGTLAYNNPNQSSEMSRGVGRFVANTSKACTAGTVASIDTSAPPVVTFSGANLITGCGYASGAHSDLIFCKDDDAGANAKYCVPIKSIDGANQATLAFIAYKTPTITWGQYPGHLGASTYHIYKMAEITALGLPTGSVTITKGATDWAANDNIEIPPHYAWWSTGLHLVFNQDMPAFANSVGVRISGPTWPLSKIYDVDSGAASIGFNFQNTWKGSNGTPSLAGTLINMKYSPYSWFSLENAPSGIIYPFVIPDASGNVSWRHVPSTYDATNGPYEGFMWGGDPSKAINFLMKTGTLSAMQFKSRATAPAAPLDVGSNTTLVPNLNADLLDGKDWAAPANIGSTTPATGAFTTLTGTYVRAGDAASGQNVQLDIVRSAGNPQAVMADLQSPGPGAGGYFRFMAKDNGGNPQTLALFGGFMEATHATAPAGYLGFRTTPLGGTLTERMRITSAGLVTLGGVTSSYPALKRTSAALNVRLADDSADAALSASTLTSTVATGTAPFTVASTTAVTNLTANWLGAVNQTWATPPAIGSTTPNAGTFSTLTAASLIITGTGNTKIDTGVDQGTGIKHGRVTTGSINSSSSAAVTLTWGGTAFANTSYTVTCSVLEATTSTSTLRIHHVESVTASTAVVRIVNDDGAGAHTGTLNCIAMHD